MRRKGCLHRCENGFAAGRPPLRATSLRVAANHGGFVRVPERRPAPNERLRDYLEHGAFAASPPAKTVRSPGLAPSARARSRFLAARYAPGSAPYALGRADSTRKWPLRSTHRHVAERPIRVSAWRRLGAGLLLVEHKSQLRRAQRRASSNRGSSRTAARSSSLRASSRNRGSSSTDRRRWANVSSPVSPASVAKHA